VADTDLCCNSAVMSTPFGYEVYVGSSTHADAEVRAAARNYTGNQNEAFVASGDTSDIRDRLCEDCPAAVYCGSVAMRVAACYPDRMIPGKDHTTLAERGILVDKDEFRMCALPFMRKVLGAVLRDECIAPGEDPSRYAYLHDSGVEAVRGATDQTMANLRKGIRL